MSTATGLEHQSEQDKLKRLVATAAAAQLEDGAIVGLGSGTTATLVVAAIGERVAKGLRITGIPTSEKTADQANALHIPLATLADFPQVDVTIDGADEVEQGTLNLIKGGGGNLLREKIVAAASTRMVIVVDQSKVVPQLGTHFKVPVEVAQFGWQSTSRRLTGLNGNPVLRQTLSGESFVTDGGNYILDCAFGPIASAPDLAKELDGVVGVVEHGLFIHLASQVLVGTSDGVKTLNPV